jgi:hypothetical protein
MGRYQRGHVYEAFGAFHVRYYQTELAAGQPKRVQRSQRLCAKDHKHHTVKCKPDQTLAAEEMQKVNAIAGSLTRALEGAWAKQVARSAGSKQKALAANAGEATSEKEQ